MKTLNRVMGGAVLAFSISVYAVPQATTGGLIGPPTGAGTGGTSGTNNSNGTAGRLNLTLDPNLNPPLQPNVQGVYVNPALHACVQGTLDAAQNPNAPALCDQNPHPLVIVPTANAAPLTGLYNLKGNRCPDGTAPGTNECVFKIEATWQAVCGSSLNGGLCQKAKEFRINYKVSQVGQVPGVAFSSEVASGQGQRPEAIVSMAAIAMGNSTSSSITCAQLYPNDPSHALQVGVDASGGPICGADPNQAAIDSMQQKICEIETAQVNATGGATQNCNPNIVVVKLAGAAHKVEDCLGGGGVLVGTTSASETTASGSGTSLTIGGVLVTKDNVGTYNQKYFCGLAALGSDSTSCPNSWNNFAQWKKTTPKTCNAGAWSNCFGGETMDYCPSAVSVGGGGWINGALPSTPFYRYARRRHNACTSSWSCEVDYQAGTCVAIMSRVGCT